VELGPGAILDGLIGPRHDEPQARFCRNRRRAVRNVRSARVSCTPRRFCLTAIDARHPRLTSFRARNKKHKQRNNQPAAPREGKQDQYSRCIILDLSHMRQLHVQLTSETCGQGCIWNWPGQALSNQHIWATFQVLLHQEITVAQPE